MQQNKNTALDIKPFYYRYIEIHSTLLMLFCSRMASIDAILHQSGVSAERRESADH